MITETLLMTSLALGNPGLDELDLTLPEPPVAEIKRISQLERKRKTFQFIDVTNLPTEEQLRMSKILHALDVATTIYGLKNANVSEGNPLLSENPNAGQLISQKAVLLTLYHHNAEEGQIVFMNYAVGVAVIRNIYVINKYE